MAAATSGFVASGNLIALHYAVMWEFWFLEQFEVPKLWSYAIWAYLAQNTLYVKNRLKYSLVSLLDIFQ